MNKILFTLVVITFSGLGFLAACDSPSHKVETAREDLKEAKAELSQSRKDSAADYALFRQQSEERISINEKAIEAFKARLHNEKGQVKADDQKIIDGLEQKNIDLRKKMSDYEKNGVNKFEVFKIEFNRDLDELGSAISNFTVKNVK